MSWSLPRLYLRPQRDSRSSELSVRRPLFCTAIFRRTGFGEFDSSAIELQPLGHGAIGQAALQLFVDGPAIRHRLQFRRRAQIAEKTPAFLDAAQRQYRRAQRAFVLLFLPQGDETVGFHGGFGVPARMY